MTKAYEAANKKSNEATRAFHAAQKLYRAGEINDTQFLAVKQFYDKVAAEFDVAFAAEQEFEALVQIETIEQTTKQESLFTDTASSDTRWSEYDAAAEWCAKRGLKGKIGDPLPNLMSKAAVDIINEDPEAFETRVRETAYAIAMEKHS